MSNEPHGFVGDGMTLAAHAALIKPCSWRNPMTTKKYRCYVTRRDAGGNTKQTTDYCEATSTSEAQRTFQARYPGCQITGVREVS